MKQFRLSPCATVSTRKSRLVNAYFRLSEMFAAAKTDARRRTLEKRRGRIAAAACEA
jgi:hypothetical protein